MAQSKVQGRTGESVTEASYFQGRSQGRGGFQGLIFVTTKRTKADLNSQQLKHFGLPLRTLQIEFPMTHISKFLVGGGELPNKERFRRSVVNQASNTTLGTPLCKMAGYAPNFCLNTLEMSLWGYHLLSRNVRPN